MLTVAELIFNQLLVLLRPPASWYWTILLAAVPSWSVTLMFEYTTSSAAAADERSLIINEWSGVKTGGKSLQSVTVRVNTASLAACIGEGITNIVTKVNIAGPDERCPHRPHSPTQSIWYRHQYYVIGKKYEAGLPYYHAIDSTDLTI